MRNLERNINIIIGPIIYVICTLFLPHNIFDTIQAREAVGVILWMAYWWVTAPVDYAVTAFLPIVLNAIFEIIPMEKVTVNYSSETIILLLAASIMTVSWGETGLDKRIALKISKRIGVDLRKNIVIWFLVSAILSAVLPNAVVCAIITPIAVAMLKYNGDENIAESEAASKILVTIVYATGVGGLISPLGGAMNLVAVDYIQKISGKEFFYITWVIKFLPVALVLIVSNIVFLLRNVKKDTVIGKSQSNIKESGISNMELTFEEKVSMTLFLIVTILVFMRPIYQDIFPGLKPAYVFLTGAIFIFLVSKKNGERLLVWKNVQTKVIWELMYIFAGGLAAGALINESGAAENIGTCVKCMSVTGGFVTISIILFATIILSDVTSNTATAAVAIPIVISITKGAGINPIPYIFIAAIGINLSYMLPTSIRAIPVGYGLRPQYMFKEGWKISIMVWILMSVIGYILLQYWPYFSKV